MDQEGFPILEHDATHVHNRRSVPASQANRSSTRLVSPPDPWAIISAAIVRIVVYRSMSYGFSAKVKPVWARAFSLRAHSSQFGSIG